jgi:thiamine biosynthesis lipoprotein ApbE
MKTYVFNEQMAVGDAGERVLDAFFIAKGYDVNEVGKDDQKRGIDRIMINPKGELLLIEYKTDAVTSSPE